MKDIEMENEYLCALPFLNSEYFIYICFIGKSTSNTAICVIRKEYGVIDENQDIILIIMIINVIIIIIVLIIIIIIEHYLAHISDTATELVSLCNN